MTGDFDTDYIGAWFEEQNHEAREEIRRDLHLGLTRTISFQPGDGTRYEFILSPAHGSAVISNDGREPEMTPTELGLLYAVVLNGLGDGVGTFNYNFGDTMENARYRIGAKMRIPNVCTAEALAACVYVLWYGGGQNEEG